MFNYELLSTAILAILVLGQGAAAQETCGPGFPDCPSGTMCCPFGSIGISTFGHCLPECSS
ncbi:hypothetical protein C8R44DRAFT_888513 [Mycena epipterygia]|nr:hypothetical protein C8R44DRAFT_888513 [Mycena epipterygia]